MISNRVKRTISSTAIALSLSTSIWAAQDYADALHKSTYFFGAQRCGATNSWIHGDCHLGDRTKSAGSKTVDLEGGWHDCGDHVKFGHTANFAAAMMLHSYLYFPNGHANNYDQDYSGTNNVPDVLDEVKIYTDYLLKTLVGDRLYYQVSSADVDHNSVSEPVHQSSQPSGSTYRQAFWVEQSGASNIAGTNAAILAMMSKAYREFDSGYADKCLAMAKKMYTFGDNNHESIPSLNSSWEAETYDGGEWLDDMAFGAAELYNATGESSYKDAAKSFMNDIVNKNNYVDKTTSLLPSYFAPDYTNVATLAAYSYQKNSSDNSFQANFKSEIESYSDYFESGLGMHFFGYNGESWGSLKYSTAAAYAALLYHDLDNGYLGVSDFVQTNIDFILGDHGSIQSDAPSGYSFLVDYGSSYPNEQIHHSAAYGQALNDYDFGGWHDDWSANSNKLTGAIVGGPTTASGGYVNDRDNPSWGTTNPEIKSNEVCTYYNAPFVAAVGAMIGMEGNIVLDNTVMSSGQPSGTEVATVTAIDPDAENFTYSLKQGGSEFTLSGNKLKTSKELTAGSYTVEIESSSNKGKITKSFTIEVSDGGSDNNLVYELGWFAYAGSGSTLNGSKTQLELDDVLADGVVSLTFNSAKQEGTIYPYATLTYSVDSATAENFSNTGFIKVEYKSDNAFDLKLPMTAVKDDAHYFATMPSTNGILKTITLNVDEETFKQPADWGDKVAFDKTDMLNFEISPAFDGADGFLQIETVEIDGFKATPIGDAPVAARKTISIGAISAKQLNLNVPAAGSYRIEMFTLNGQRIASMNRTLQGGKNAISWNGNFSKGMFLVTVRGEGISQTSKAIIK